MTPLKNFVLVTEIKTNDKETASGIILTQSITTGAQPGLVLEVGPDVEGLSQGDRIALDWQKGLPVTIEDVKCVLVADEFIRGVY